MLKKLPTHIFFSILSVLMIFALVPLYAQEIPSNIANMLSAEQLEDLKKKSNQTVGSNNNNLPTSTMPEEKNIRDLKIEDEEKLKVDNENRLSTVSNDTALVNYYYKILTEEHLDIFGKDTFAINKNDDLLFYNTPGDDYKLAAGDVVQVITRGLSVINEEAQIDNVGRLKLSIIAPFLASGKTITEIRDHISKEIRIDDASASAYVSLNAARLIQVKVTGEVKAPQTIAVPAYTPLSQVLIQVGGISDIGSLRNIIVTNAKHEKERIDLYKILRESKNFKEPLINASSRIHVNDLGATVAVAGFVGRPGIFELPYGKTQISALELMQLSNAKFIPPGSSFEVLKFDDKGLVDSTTFESPKDIILSEGQALRIKFIENRNLHEIKVEGAVLRPFSIIAKKDGISIKKVLKNGAALNEKAIERIAVVTSKRIGKQSTRIIDLGKIFNSDEDLLLFPGETVTILDEKSYRETLNNIENDLRFQKSSLIYLNNKVIAMIPDHPTQSAADIIRTQLLLTEDIVRDFALLSRKQFLGKVQTHSFNLGKALTVPNGEILNGVFEITLFTKKYLSEKLTELDDLLIKDSKIAKIKKTNPVEIFVDGQRMGILPSDTTLGETNLIQNLRINKGLYPLFARITNNDQMKNNLKKTFINANLSNVIFNDMNFETKPGQRIDIFSTQFVRNLFSQQKEEQSSDRQFISSDTKQIIQEASSESNIGLELDDVKSQEVQATKFTLAALRRSSRLITGAIESPGFYPIAGQISLSDLIDVAGGTLPGSDLSRINIRKYETYSNGISDISEVIILDANSVDITKIVLSGDFDVKIPSVVNDAAIGIVYIEGEVLRPGEYVVSRNETLSEVIERAGGLTKVAYPLGLNFARETLKTQERQTNLILANKLEQSIISLSQNQQEGAGDQITAILAYAKQLRALPVNGRQTVNYASISQTDNIYLEDGDTIFIPKRPSHVSITGRVQNATIASYGKNKKMKDYINDAGGLDRIADIKNIFVTLPNGKSLTQERLKESGGIIPPGSVIIIPPKTDKLSLLGLTEVFSKVLGNIATSILAINAVSN